MPPLPSRLSHLLLPAFIAVLVASGCARDLPLGDPAPLAAPQIVTGWIEGAQGDRLALNVWPARGRTRAVILAIHGYGDHGTITFDSAARAWAVRGITTYAYDQRGFGANASRLDWPGAAVLEDDAVAVSRAVRARHPGVPLTVVGHSMGGGVALAAAARGLQADRLVLAGPAIAGGDQVNPFLRLGAHLVGAVAPDHRFTGDGVVSFHPTDNREALLAAARDPLRVNDPSGRELLGLLAVMDDAAAAAPAVTRPVLTLMGAHDELLRPDAVSRVAARIPAGEYRLYPDGWHWLFRDLQAPVVWADVGDFALGQAIAAAGASR